jgi:hypothetical protein
MQIGFSLLGELPGAATAAAFDYFQASLIPFKFYKTFRVTSDCR